MGKTKEELREYNRLKAQERKARLKAEGKPLNSPKTVKKAQKKYIEKKKKETVNKTFLLVPRETIKKYDDLKPDGFTEKVFLF